MSTRRLTLAQQLKQLESDDPSSNPLFNPDNDDSALDGLSRPAEGVPREHYLDVGPSRLRNQIGGLGGEEQTLRSEKYEGKVTGRMKIFDDDEDEEGGDGADGEEEEDEDDEEGDEEEGDGEGEEDDDEDEDEDEEESDGDEDEEDEDEEDDEDEGEEEDEVEESAPPRARPGSSKALDPIAALKDSRLKDIEKGRGIRRQRSLFENLITLRISFQKAFVAGSKLSFPLPSDPEGEIEAKRQDTLRSLAELSDKLFALREALPLPGVELPEGLGLGKRKRGDADDDVLEEQYWMAAAGDSLEIENASRPHLVPILNKWSSKIQAATLQLGSKQAGSSKFLASTKGVPGIVEAIEAGIAGKRESDKTLVENEEASYRALLREVIESRGAAGSGVDLTHLRREKKKKREAERGGSKGRKLRYTVHEKAQNFVVPIPLGQGWHEEQVDELFSSLFGGVGMSGAVSEGMSNGVGASESEGAVGLGGLRVF